MRVADINCDTSLGSFIDIEVLEADLDYIYGEFLKKIKDSVQDTIDSEIKTGGLDEYSLNIGGKPILQEKSIKVHSGLAEICADLTNLKEEILVAAKEHKKAELNQYISALNIKLKSIQSELNRIQAQINEDGWFGSIFKSYYSEKMRYENQQNHYRQMLEAAKATLAKIN